MTRFKSILLSATVVLVAVWGMSASAFEFHGYMRAGTGANSEGGDQVCFQAPGARAKYRLGNECEVYSELAFSQNLFKSEGEDQAYFNIHTLLAFVVEGEGDFEEDDPAFREVWIESGNIFGGSLAGAKFWAGKRFYRRHDIHINDFYFWGQGARVGGGIEDLDLGFGKLAYGYFRNSNDDFNVFTVALVDPVTGEPTGEVRTLQGDRIQVNDRAVSAHDIRVYDIDVNPNGKLTVGLDFRFSEEDRDGFGGEDGFMVTALHFQDGLFGGFNKLALQYGQGAASTLSDFSNDTADSDVKTWRIVNQTLFEPNDTFSALLALVYEDRKNDPGNLDNWFSAGIRPKYYFTDYFNVALELGYDQVKPERGDTRRLTKFTVAPQISAGRGFWARPALRLYLTYADWNDAANQAGVITTGASPFDDDTHGWSYGIQAEAWW